MNVVNYDGTQVGVLTEDGEGIIDLTDRCDITSTDPVREFIAAGHDPSEYAGKSADVALSDVDLGPPIRRPRKIVAVNSNWPKETRELSWDASGGWEGNFKEDGPFLKSSRSVIGPGDTIEVPFTDRRIDHELELGFVTKAGVKDISREEASDNIFGFTFVNDVTMRGPEVRSYRKSFDTFTAVGPTIATTDSIDDPQNLAIELRKNGEVVQRANTKNMVFACDEILEFISQGATMGAGDIVATGTPLGCSQLEEGDVIEATVEGVGTMTNTVSVADAEFEQLY